MGFLHPDFVVQGKALNGTEALSATEVDTLATLLMDSSYEYEGIAEEPLKQTWNFAFVIFAYVLACVASYSAVHLMDHCLWRSEELKKAAIIKYPDVYAAIMLGFGAVWCMHFVGLSAVTIEGIPICYDWAITVGSLAAVVVLMFGAIKVAGNDVFATPDRIKVLEGIVGNNYVSDKEAAWKLTKVTCFYRLQHLAMGSFLAASGAIVMHYTGTMAKKGPFRKEWDVGLIAVSCCMALIFCFVGFWIIFRLQWRISQQWLRYLSAGVIAFAFCTLHFFGMLCVTYFPGDTSSYTCQKGSDKNGTSPGAWTGQQVVILAVAIIVPTLAFFISNTINQELILAYQVTARSNAIVSSLFPAQIRERMMADEKSKLKSFLFNTSHDSESGEDVAPFSDDESNKKKSKPIADLFTDTTVMFADIAGFTAWSSEREPSQVFTLLETIYEAYDEITKQQGAFKVETVGDCYVAVAGLPDPRKDHAVVMSRVASRCVYKMGLLTKRLEVTLGPDTGDLNVRIGLHSGPVTAGVLRGDRARFQLFGDTMNMAARMESTALPGKVHVSAETAELLKATGKERWLIPRANEVFVKGKGQLQTYWLNVKGSSPKSHDSSDISSSHAHLEEIYQIPNDKAARLIEWNVDILKGALKQIVARRNAMAKAKKKAMLPRAKSCAIIQPPGAVGSVIDEVCEIIELPDFDHELSKKQEDPESIELPEDVVQQLKKYVTSVADLYHNNPFHNFEHASHVIMSVSKLLSRIVAHSSDRIDTGKCVASSLHDHTYGITSDPLTQFACILSALIHDADHVGVPNTQLVKEETETAKRYKGKSVAEQNSVVLSWEMLLRPEYCDLRGAIAATDAEWTRLKQLVVNSVMATDIMDKDLKGLRNARWEKAFSEQDPNEDARVTTNRKATIVIEHLIQASDVAHTMQHWHVYRKWNQRLFEEMYKAYKEGRSEKDPTEFWYKGEIGFFDFYIIPLAKKLKDCGVFGVASDEYLTYALQNRREWEARGEAVVDEMIEKVKAVWEEEVETTDTFDDEASMVSLND
ncbi:Receptor-type guanylate cyclase gcy [Seminavis robusta]|uniref:Receptor-type guanylate cyclase gcy n=1 Tax=Seminavis robusta TaxID=568900 RepID=A0A9N8E6Z5_9STRA|nr:Receptor-type guanylate cyclase gcy [Seminavis robusta]|eukprot:Sro731_g194190.1 Receptor-type guanylate cyclase gcy (1038) ;mRNA; r:11980-15667